jgi:muramoyltetrapeptide carboxypeptidase
MRLVLHSPAGVVREAGPVRRAARRLAALGFEVALDASALAKHQRFAGDDATRLAALHRIAAERPSVALATRGGYGMTRLLPALDWKAIGRSVEAGTRWVGQSDLTSLQLGLLAMRKGAGGTVAWAGPLAADDFGRDGVEGGGDDVTQACFVEAMAGELEGIGFRTAAGLDGLEAAGTLWGGNLTVVLSLLGTPHWPDVKGGIFFFEDVNEHPYRIERGLLQLAQAGVLDRQKAIVVGEVSGWRKSANDRGYTLASALERVRAATRTPVVVGLPHGHGPLKVSLPVGARARLLVDGRDAWLGW